MGQQRPQQQISPGDLASALGADQISTLTSQTGLSRDELLAGLAKQLPDVINQLTPNGRAADRKRSLALDLMASRADVERGFPLHVD